jgi:hypothetical protein
MIKAGSSDTILKIDNLKIIQANFGLNWYNDFRDVLNSLHRMDGRQTPSDGNSSLDALL